MMEQKIVAQEKPMLTISLLASNRPDTIRRCLDSLRPIQKAISSELIIVDTSNNSQITELLLEYTDQVYSFDWCNDFAKARNLGLKKAKGEWFLYLDDDEWFLETENLIQFFQAGTYQEYGSACYQVRNYYDADYTIYEDIWVSRMIRLDTDTEFRSKIHEYLYPMRGKSVHIDAIAGHSGYIYQTEEDKHKHFDRNAKLLKEMIEEEPDNYRWHMQLVQEYRSVKAWDTLVKFCKEVREGMKVLDEKYTNIYLGSIYAGAIEAHIQQKEYDQALALCTEAFNDGRNTALCRLYIQLKCAQIYAVTGKLIEANIYASAYLQDIEILEKEDALSLQMMALLVNEAMHDENRNAAQRIQEASDIRNMTLSDWMTYVGQIEKEGFFQLEKMNNAVLEAFGENDIRYFYFMKCYGNHLIRLESDAEDFEQLYKRFFDFMEYTLGYYLCVFQDKAFQDEMEMLPSEAKAAVLLHRMFSREENDWMHKIRDLKECAKIYPVLGNNIKRLVNKLKG